MNVYPIEYVLAEAEFLRQQVDALHIENAKLRELVSKLHYHYKGVMLEGMTFLGQAEIDGYEAEMRELGIEVD